MSFGHVYLAPLIQNMHHDDVEDLAQFAFDAVCLLIAGQSGPMDEGFKQVLNTSGIDQGDFVKGLEEAAQLGVARELPPGQIHSLKDLMMPAIVRIGLVTPRTRALFDAARIPVFEDQTVLRAMEDARSATNVLSAEGARY